jgi:hypothetical protein
MTRVARNLVRPYLSLISICHRSVALREDIEVVGLERHSSIEMVDLHGLT